MNKVVMILTNLFRPDVRVLREAEYLVDQGFEVEILCWDRKNEFVKKPVEFIDKIKIKRFYPKSEPGTGFKQLKAYIMFILQCKKYLKNKNFDFIHCHDLDGAIVGSFVKRINSKFIFDMHEYYLGKTKKLLKRVVTKQIVNYYIEKSDFVVYVNEIQKKDIGKVNEKKMIHLPNYPVIDEMREIKREKSDKLRISYIGVVRQFDELKNLMDACCDFEDVQIYIHGSGVHYEKIKEIETNYSNVTITGPFHHYESAKLYSETDISYIVYPMNNTQNIYGEPVKFFEAIATETPMIVSSEMKISRFVIENNIGYVVDGNDVNDIRRLIHFIQLNKSDLEEKIENIREVQYKYNWDEIVRNLDLVYK